MKPQAVWTIVFLAGAAALAWRAAATGMGQVYVRAVPVQGVDALPTTPPGEPKEWTRYDEVSPKHRNEADVQLSLPRTVGVWVAAILSLAVLSFLFGDNVFYKFAESVVVGASAAYVMVLAFWSTIVQNLLPKLTPNLVRGWAMPGLPPDQPVELSYLVPLALGAMLMWRLSPKGGWISRWPLAFFIGATAGFRLIGHLEADFVGQISNTILPLVVMKDGSLDFAASLKNCTILVGTLSCVTYFFFSIEHKGFVGAMSRLGIWFLMITFGAGFGYTVMGRITLLAARFEFLLDDWLWLIDPLGRR